MMGESDDCIARLAKKDGILSKYVLNLKLYRPKTNAFFSFSETTRDIYFTDDFDMHCEYK